MNDTVKRVEQLEREIVGLPYRFWLEGSDWSDVQAMSAPWLRPGFNCTSSYNSIFGRMRDEGYRTGPIGGTTDFCSALGSDGSGNWERFNINKNYPPGVFLVSPYTSETYQGHNARVYSWEDSSRNQYMAQDAAGDSTWWEGGWLWGSPGFNYKRTMAETHAFSGFVWAGTLPGVPLLDGYPGDTATVGELVEWIVAFWRWWGFPEWTEHYPLNVILTENTPVLSSSRGRGNLRDLDGYWQPVDHDSYGPMQMRATYWPLPWDFASSLLCFARAMQDAHGLALPVDQWGTARAIQAVWRSFDPTGSNYAAHYGEARELADAARVHDDDAPEEEREVEWTRLDGLWVAGEQGHVWGELKDGKVKVRNW